MKKASVLMACLVTASTLLFRSSTQAQNVFPATGSVGIGTNAPANKLHVLTNQNFQGITITHSPNSLWSQQFGGSLTTGSYNFITQWGDGGIVFGGATPGNGGGYVIAPWATLASGLRMDNQGSITVSTEGSLATFRIMHKNGLWTKFFAGSLENGAYNGMCKVNDAGVIFGGASVGNGGGYVIAPWANATTGLRIANDGKVAIGNVTTIPSGYSLFVQTGILTEKVKVAVAGSANWADYVFNKEYKLMPLTELEKFIQANKHLPNILSAEEMIKEGNDLGATDARLLAKIEELTLYIIEMKKEIDALKQTNNK